jgi:hypothetical protein
MLNKSVLEEVLASARGVFVEHMEEELGGEQAPLANGLLDYRN